MLGNVLGLIDGCKLGTDVGMSDGCSLGASLGDTEGLLDGLAVGKGEGAGDGGLDGSAVGTAGTGAAVGEAVGALVHVTSHATGHSSLTNDPLTVWPHHSALRVASLFELNVIQLHVLVVVDPLYSYVPKVYAALSVQEEDTDTGALRRTAATAAAAPFRKIFTILRYK